MNSNQIYYCSRCGFETGRRDNFLRHLKRKVSCQAKLEDVSTKDLYDKYFNTKRKLTKKPKNVSLTGSLSIIETSDDKFKCPHCDKVYKYLRGCTRHLSVCLYNLTLQTKNKKENKKKKNMQKKAKKNITHKNGLTKTNKLGYVSDDISDDYKVNATKANEKDFIESLKKLDNGVEEIIEELIRDYGFDHTLYRDYIQHKFNDIQENISIDDGETNKMKDQLNQIKKELDDNNISYNRNNNEIRKSSETSGASSISQKNKTKSKKWMLNELTNKIESEDSDYIVEEVDDETPFKPSKTSFSNGNTNSINQTNHTNHTNLLPQISVQTQDNKGTILNGSPVDNSVNINHETNVSNVGNITNNIIVNEFGNENLDHISQQDWKKIVYQFYRAIPALVQKVHIDNKENQNVYFSNIRGEYALVFEHNRWKMRRVAQVLEDIIVKNTDRLYDYVLENEEKLGNKTCNRMSNIIEEVSDGEQLFRKYKTEVKGILIEHRNNVKRYYEDTYKKKLKV